MAAKVLTLEAHQNYESTLFLFERDWSVRFVPGASLFAYDKIQIYTNYPFVLDGDNQDKFDRKTYKEVIMTYYGKGSIVAQSMNWSATIKFSLPGAYHYYFTSTSPGQHPERLGSGYFQVRPSLTAGPCCRPLPLDCLQCQTVLSKNLGTIDSWLDRLAVSHECGYNMVHFTPIQELGGSDSAYSIRDQLKVNPTFNASYKDVAKVVKTMNEDWQVLSITDIVLNHTANESTWLQDHPDATYNCNNSPHLRPAYLLDRALFALTIDMQNLRWLKTHSLGNHVSSEADLKIIDMLLTTFYLPTVRIHEMFMLDIDRIVTDFERFLQKQEDSGDSLESSVDGESEPKIKVIQDRLYRRFHSTIDFELASKFTRNHDLLRQKLKEENDRIKSEIEQHLDCAIKNVYSAIRYERLQADGPKVHYVTVATPLVAPYFKSLDYPNSNEKVNLRKEETFMYDQRQSQFLMAHNGWVMNYDPLRNFAAEGSLIYFRRELIAWGDSVKLRYGNRPEDSPFLWEHMRHYVEKQAEIFNGLRLDNCHSTPIHVAEYMLDAARLVRPDLYIIAELFTSSEEADNIFINRLGITSLVRESMSAPNSRELGRLMYRFGGQPVGAFHHAPGSQPLRPCIAHAIFYDQTHDNESPLLRKSPYDCQATSSIVSMACCALGTSRGYDELVPHHISVVSEKRLYQPWGRSQPAAILSSQLVKTMQDQEENVCVSAKTGIVALRRLINDLHSRLYLESFSEIFVDQVDDNVIAITRHNPHDCRSVVLIARTAFDKMTTQADEVGLIRPIYVPGNIARLLFEAKMIGDPGDYERNEKHINGLKSFRTEILNSQLVTDKLSHANLISVDSSQPDEAKIIFDNFVPSSVIALEAHASQNQSEALRKVRSWLKNYLETGTPADLLYDVLEPLSLSDLNYILYRSGNESASSDDNQDPVYELSGIGKFHYSGFQGFMFTLSKVHDTQDQAHPICSNLRAGNWLIDHTLNRLYKRKSLVAFAGMIKEPLEEVGKLPRGIVPKYFDMVMTSVYDLIINHKVPQEMGSFVKNGPKLVKQLALSSLALIGESPDAPLPPWLKKATSNCPTLAAGLPHFASGYMRIWGRDTFIAMRGMLLLTERFREAKCIILSFAATLRHGLIPNLLDRGSHARYNCRDAVWWWLYCIKEYTELKSYDILEEQVRRIYPYDHSEPQLTTDVAGREQPLYAIMQEAIERHFDGIDFVERNAGKKIDEHMTDPGFHIKVNVDRETGFVFGGNQWNCGTWMDKMGSSVKAKTKGEPSSPRDGAAVEIVGLSYAVIKWLAKMNKENKYRYKGVESKKNADKLLWVDWLKKLEASFEKHFWVSDNDKRPDLVNRRHIYKDLWGCEKDWQAYQFRPNFLVAMVVAPELFNADNARECLATTREVLAGPLGMKTLDPTDWNYNGDYDNSDDSENRSTAHGFNYHQGPEWLWLTGYYLRALMKLGPSRQEINAFQSNLKHVKRMLAKQYRYLENDSWYGLPELTNSDGQFCKDSCPIQAWSIGTTIEAVYDLSKVKTIV